MAIRKRPGRPSPFQVFWNNPFTGKRESKSFASLDEAKKHDSLIKHQLRYERDLFRPQEDEGDTAAITADSLAYLYIKSKKPTRDNAQRLISNLRPILNAFGHMPPEELTKQDMLKAMQAMRESGTSAGTVRVRFAHFKAILRWGVESGFIPSCPDFRIPKADPVRIPSPTPNEAAEIMRCAASHIQRVIVLGMSIGLRIGQSELFGMKWEDIDLENEMIRVWSAKKNLKVPWRDIPIKKSLLPLLMVWKEKDGKGQSFVINFEGRQVKSIKTAWKNACKRSKITRRIRPYDLRHAFATEALAAGADIRTIAELMGHADVTMVLRHYQHVLDRQKKSAVEAVPDIPACAQEDVPKKETVTQ